MINKSSLLSQISSAIATLNLPAADTRDLLIFLKTAQNTGVDANTIVTQLTSRIQAISTSADLQELLLLVSAVSLITPDRMLSVPDLTTLNALTNISAGTIYFVDSEGVPYIRKSNGTWVLIDPSLHPQPLPNVWTWGSNADGRLGDGTTTNRSSPVSVVGGFTDWVQISTNRHGLAIRANGTLWAWGNNSTGQLGDGTIIDRLSPVSVVGGFTDWVQISAPVTLNGFRTAAIRANGTAWAWGLNNSGQLGDDTTASRRSPVSVVGGFTDWVQISAGDAHTAAIRANGTAWAWGSNGSGQLGDNSGISKSSPVSVVGGFTDWVQISAGGAHTAAIRANGTAWAWGLNSNGRLGNNTTTNQSSPVSVVGGFTDWVQISASTHTAAIRANGTAWAWGANLNGQLGDNSGISKSSPVSVVGGFTDWVQISAGSSHTAAIRANGTAWAWGNNLGGQLGDNTTTSRSSPVSVVGGFTDWVQISPGLLNTAAIRGSNSV